MLFRISLTLHPIPVSHKLYPHVRLCQLRAQQPHSNEPWFSGYFIIHLVVGGVINHKWNAVCLVKACIFAWMSIKFCVYIVPCLVVVQLILNAPCCLCHTRATTLSGMKAAFHLQVRNHIYVKVLKMCTSTSLRWQTERRPFVPISCSLHCLQIAYHLVFKSAVTIQSWARALSVHTIGSHSAARVVLCREACCRKFLSFEQTNRY